VAKKHDERDISQVECVLDAEEAFIRLIDTLLASLLLCFLIKR